MTSRILKDIKINVKDPEQGFEKKLILRKVKLENGLTENFFITEDGDSVQVFPVTEDNKIYCVKQYRPGRDCVAIELPGGGLHGNEDPGVAAERELKEETSLIPGKLIFLGTMGYGPYSTGKKHMYLALDCKPTGKLDLDPNEFLKVISYNFDEFKELLRKGEIRGTDCAALGLFYLPD